MACNFFPFLTNITEMISKKNECRTIEIDQKAKA